MNKDELFNEILEVCQKQQMYPEMVIKFKSDCIAGKDAQQEAEDLKNLIDSAIGKLNELENIIVDDKVDDISDSEKCSVVGALEFFKAVIHTTSADLDNIIDLGFQVAKKQKCESV